MKTKLLLIFCVVTGSLFAQAPAPWASFPFDENILDAEENVTSEAMGTTVPTIVEDPVRGNVLSFPGGVNTAANCIVLGLNSFNEFEAVTYSVWIKANALATWSRFFTFGTENVSGAAAETWSTPANGRLAQRMSVTTDGGTDFDGVEVPFGDAVIQTNKWYMFTAALNSTNLKLWVDGIPIADSLHDSGTGPKDQVITVAYLGKSVWPDPLLNGYLDNFEIFGKFLTDEEVAALYTAEFIAGTGVKEIDNAIKMVVYSASNQIIIQNPQNAIISSIQIYSVTGSLVLETSNYDGVINHNLPANIYIVRIQTNLGEFVTKIAV